MKKNNYLSFFIFLNSTFLIQRSIILECTETVNLVGESAFFSIRIEANAIGNEVLRLISYELGHHASPPQSTDGTPAGLTWGQLRGEGEAVYNEFLWNRDLVEGRGGQVCSVQEAEASPNIHGCPLLSSTKRLRRLKMKKIAAIHSDSRSLMEFAKRVL